MSDSNNAKLEAIQQKLERGQETLLEQQKKCGYLEGRYNRMAQERQPHLDAARLFSSISIPYLYPQNGVSVADAMATVNNQSVVARGIFNLAKELCSAQFPSNARMWTRELTLNIEQQLSQIAQGYADAGMAMDEDMEKEAREVLQVDHDALIDTLMRRDGTLRATIRSTNHAEVYYLSKVHQIVAGHIVYAIPTLGSARFYTLENFVTRLNAIGDATEIIVKDSVMPEDLDEAWLKKLKLTGATDEAMSSDGGYFNGLPMYTQQIKTRDGWRIKMEILGEIVQEWTEESYPPFLSLPLIWNPGCNYGIGWLQHNAGDIFQYENLSCAINDLAQAGSNITEVLPMDMTSFEAADRGITKTARTTGKIDYAQADIGSNMRGIAQVYEGLRQTLMSAFLLDEAARRDAERVTREEILTILRGLKKIFGGIYLSDAKRFQPNYVGRVEALAVKAKIIAPIPEEFQQYIKLTITAGIDILEESDELDAWRGLLTDWMALGPEFLQGLDSHRVGKVLAQLRHLPTDGILLSPEQLAEKQGLGQLMALGKQLGPMGPQILAQVVPQVIQLMQQGMTQPQEGVDTNATQSPDGAISAPTPDQAGGVPPGANPQ